MSLIERLEGRRLMSVSIATDGTTLVVSNAHDVRITARPTTLPDGSAGEQVVVLDSAFNFLGASAGQFTKLVVTGTNENDTILVDSQDLNTEIDGGNGRDFLTAVDFGTATMDVHGGNGKDSLVADSAAAGGTINLFGDNGTDSFQVINTVGTVNVAQ